MPVLMRNRSWEEHVPHGTGLQYSYDDLDIVSCHRTGPGGLSSGLEHPQGQRGRCASLPARGHRLPAEWCWFSTMVTGWKPSGTVSLVDRTGVLDSGLNLKGQLENCNRPCGDQETSSKLCLSNSFVSEAGLSNNIPQDVPAMDSKNCDYDVSQGDSEVQGELAVLPSLEDSSQFGVSGQSQCVKGDDSNLAQTASFGQEHGSASHSVKEPLLDSNAAGPTTVSIDTSINDGLSHQNGDSDPLCCISEPYLNRDVVQCQGTVTENDSVVPDVIAIGQPQCRDIVDREAVLLEPSSVAIRSNVIEEVLSTSGDEHHRISEEFDTATSEEYTTKNWNGSCSAYNTTAHETCEDMNLSMEAGSDLVNNQTLQECDKDEDLDVTMIATVPCHDSCGDRECYDGEGINAVTEERSHKPSENHKTLNDQISTSPEMGLAPELEMLAEGRTSQEQCLDPCASPCDDDNDDNNDNDGGGSGQRSEKNRQTTLPPCDFRGLSDSIGGTCKVALMDCKSPDPKMDADTNMVLTRPQGNIDNASRSSEVKDDLESNVHAPEDGTVKLRVRKAPREEQACPRLDSMALLIMKLDQLDHEIESALSSAASGTRGSNGHDMDVPEVNKNGGSMICITKPKAHQRLSAPRLQHPRGTQGAKSKPEALPALAMKDKAEIEAKEACTWLRAAGFPQYAQLYEDGQFPINISSVTCDHDFLDRDAIEALCRRLNTLNKCTMMKLEISPQRKQSEDSEEDEPCAISGRWTFQRASKRWSRLEELDVFSPVEGSPDGPLSSSESLLTNLGWSSAGPASSVTAGDGTTRTGSLASVCSSGTSGATEDSPSEGPPSPPSPGAPGFPFDGPSKSPSKSTHSKARSFLRRMESLRLRGSSTRRRKKSSSKLEISGPVLKQGPDEERLRQLHCVDVSVLRERSVSCSTQGGGGSGGSSTSEPSGGSSTVSTPSPVTRARSHSTAGTSAKRAGIYLENFDPLSLLQLQAESQQKGSVVERNRRNRKVAVCTEEEDEEDEEEEMYFFIPEGHKPGTFPKALCNGRPSYCDAHRRGPAHRRNSSGSLDSRLSFYDNVPPQEEPEEEESLAYKLDEVLRGFSDTWAERGGRAGEDGDSDSALDSASPCPSSPLQSHLEEAENGSDLDSAINEPEVALVQHERRDSGVGASLTRSNSRPPKLRWPSFQSSHRPSVPSAPLQLSAQSVLRMNLLQKFSLLKITALLEKHAPINKHGFSWAVPKFMKRTKVRDQRVRSVFGVPLQVNVQRTGQPLPLGIQQAMRYLRSQCLDQVGLFRKSGVKSRIQALRQMNEACPDGVSYEGQSAYDVADMLKQYFRDLPEPLLTSKLSETFLQIYQYVPKEQRLLAAKAAALLLPDENREALEALLCFLSDVAASAADNQMTCANLAVCLAPSLFHLNAVRRDSSSPRVMQRKQNLGKPDQRDLSENLAATQGLAHMITECRKLFQIPEEMSFCRNSYMEQELLPAGLEELEQGVGVPCLRDAMENLLKEAKDRFRGYDGCSTHEQQVELAYKKVHDGFPLRLWKASVEVPAPPEDVLTRLLRERHRWDEDMLEARVLETLDHRTEVYQYVQDSMAPRPPRDHVVLRTWAMDLPKGACAVVCASVDHQGAPLMGVRANVLAARYYMEPCGSGRTRLTYVNRIDCRGHFPEWYNKVFGQWCAAEVARIRDSFTNPLEK